MILDPKKKYHRWQKGGVEVRIYQGVRWYSAILQHRFPFRGTMQCKVDVDSRLLYKARDPDGVFASECNSHAEGMRLHARTAKK